MPADRRTASEAVRQMILANIDGDVEEGIQYGALAYVGCPFNIPTRATARSTAGVQSMQQSAQRPSTSLRCTIALLLSAVSAQAQAPAVWDPQAVLKTEHYVRPPAVIERIVLAPRTDISFDTPNADRTWFLRSPGKDRATVATFGIPHRYLGGLQVDERANRARSLTPYLFQSERRNFYEAQETYLDMSPFLRADKISGALLMYHDLEDQNTGTAPLSSTRMFAALQGLGKEAALYLYPYEDHSVATYESDLDQWARWLSWFDVHVTLTLYSTHSGAHACER